VAVATGWIDGADGWLGRALGLQTWDLKLDEHELSYPSLSDSWEQHSAYGWGIRLPLPPLASVTHVKYQDEDNDEQTFDPASYVVSGVGGRGYVHLASGASWPTVYPGRDVLTVRFQAGYATVPDPIKHAVLLMVGHLYSNREAVANAQGKPETMPMGVDALLSTFRVFC
jgi:uncharacterized phiE125 gp8 family phage protein